MEPVLAISRLIWEAMQTRDIVMLKEFIHSEAVFVHMGATFRRDDELAEICCGSLVYKNIDFKKQTVHNLDNTIIVLSQLILTAVVSGSEVVNSFLVTEVYTNVDAIIKLASLSFTKITY